MPTIEWSILAIRNICLHNPKAQSFVSSLQVQDIPEHVRREFAKKGVRISIGENGKVRMSQIAKEDFDQANQKTEADSEK